MATQSTQPVKNSPSYLGPFITVTAMFFIFGFITNLNMALVAHLRKAFSLPYFEAMLAVSAFFLAYLVFAAPTAKLIEVVGYKKTMVVALFIQVVGALVYIPAAMLISFPLFLTASFIVGAGVTALQTSANPYIAILGPEKSAPVRLNLAQAANSIGGTIAPLIAGAFILTSASDVVNPAEVANTVRTPYLMIAIGLLILGVIVMFLHLPTIQATQEFRPAQDGDALTNRSIFSYRHTVLGAIGIFFYVGVEVGLASIMVNYFQQQGVPSAAKASSLIALYWAGALVGRLLGAWMVSKVPAGRLLGLFGAAAMALVIISSITHGNVAIWALILCGFFNSIMFPNIFTLGIAGLGPMTSKGSGLIMTCVVGGAIIPPLFGGMADKVGIQHALIIPMACYLYIAYYGIRGSKQQRRATAE